jgi:hypothetical protein
MGFFYITTRKCKREASNNISAYRVNMAQLPDEKTYIEIPFIEQLKGLRWEHLEGDIVKRDALKFLKNYSPGIES